MPNSDLPEGEGTNAAPTAAIDLSHPRNETPTRSRQHSPIRGLSTVATRAQSDFSDDIYHQITEILNKMNETSKRLEEIQDQR